MKILPTLRKERYPSSNALFGVAVFWSLVGFLGWGLYGLQFSRLDWIITFGGLFYIPLGIWARWMPFPASFAGGLLFFIFLVYQATVSASLLIRGWLFVKLPVLALLLYAIIVARRKDR